MKKFEDFEVEFETKDYYFFISTPSNENWGGVIVTFATQSNINSDDETEWNEMHLANKEMLASVLTTFFKLNDEEVKDILNDIEEDEDNIDYKTNFYRLAVELINTQNYSVDEILDMMGVSNEYERKILRSKLEEEI